MAYVPVVTSYTLCLVCLMIVGITRGITDVPDTKVTDSAGITEPTVNVANTTDDTRLIVDGNKTSAMKSKTNNSTNEKGLMQEIKIAGLFADATFDKEAEEAFIAAVNYINSRHDILPNVKLTYKLYRPTSSIESDNLFVVQSACKVVQDEVGVVVGPSTSSSVKASASIFSALHIPQISPFATDPTLSITRDAYPFLFKLSIPDTYQSEALVDIVKHFVWTRISIVAASTEYGQNGLRLFEARALSNDWTLTSIGYFYPSVNLTTDTIEALLAEVKTKGTRVILLNCLAPSARLILEQASLMGMTDEGWAWLVTDGVTSLPGLYKSCENVPYHLRGLLGTKPADAQGAIYRDYLHLWNTTGRHEEVYSTLIFDSVLVAAHGLHDYLEEGHVYEPPRFNSTVCLGEDHAPWPPGEVLRDYIRNISADGVTKYLNFTDFRHPDLIEFSIVNLQRYGWQKIGSWKESDVDSLSIDNTTITFQGSTEDIPLDNVLSTENVTFRIVTIVEAPYVQLAEEQSDSDNGTAEPVYEGYCLDLLRRLQEELNFRYELYVVPDGTYGKRDPDTGIWSGLMGELTQDRADIIIAPLTINYNRHRDVAFTKPFQDFGSIIVMVKSTSASSLLSFFDPFSWGLWLVVGASFIVCGVVNAVVSWLSPHGHRGLYTSRLRPASNKGREDRNTFNLWNSLWYSFSQWMMQGAEAVPQNFSGRVVYGVWYFVIMVISATYTANLAAFLTVQRLDSGISSLDDLAKQTTIKYGTVADSAVDDYFKTQTTDPYVTMSSVMQRQKSNVRNTSDGIQRVLDSYGKPKKDQYAFIFDSPPLEYAAASPPCRLNLIGRTFNRGGYGIALQKGSPYINMFSLEVLRLRQSGFLQSLQSKWVDSGSCSSSDVGDDDNSDTQQASLTNMAGVFLFLVVGLVLALPVVLCEYCAAAWRDRDILYKRKGARQSLGRAFNRRCRAICGDFRDNGSVFMGAPDPSSDSSDTEGDQPVQEKSAQSQNGKDQTYKMTPYQNYGFELDQFPHGTNEPV